MGESGVGAGEPTEPPGVGGIKVIMGKNSSRTSKLEGDVPPVFMFVDQPVVGFRALTGWRCRCSESSTSEIHDTVGYMSDLLMVSIRFIGGRSCILGGLDNGMTSV